MPFVSCALSCILRVKKIPALLLHIVVDVGLAVLFFTLSPPPCSFCAIVTVDVTGVVARFVKETTKAQLTPTQLNVRVQAFGQALDSALNTAVKTQHAVLLPKEAVVAGAKDITPLIERAVSRQLAKGVAP